jgi:hypothetical protein
VAARITLASLPPTFRERVRLKPPMLSDVLMAGAYRGTGLAARVLPTLTNPWTVANLMGSEDEDPASAVLGVLLRGASTVTSALRAVRSTSAAPRGDQDGGPRPARWFFTHVLDQTGDGTLSWPDLAALAREISSRLDLDADREAAVYSAFHAWWQELAAALDTDGDEVISLEEYAAGAASLPAPALVRLADVLFEVTDTDHDGTISPAEYRRLLHTGFSHELAVAPGADLSKVAFTTEFLHFMGGRRPSTAWQKATVES